MDFSKMKMTHRQLSQNTFEIRVGQDFIEVWTNYGWMTFPSTLEVYTIRHYIKSQDNVPTNPKRTTILLSEVEQYFKKLYLKELETEIINISKLPATGKLESDYDGKRFSFICGTSAESVLNELRRIYDAYESDTFFCKSFFAIETELSQNSGGFLYDAIQEDLSWI